MRETPSLIDRLDLFARPVPAFASLPQRMDRAPPRLPRAPPGLPALADLHGPFAISPEIDIAIPHAPVFIMPLGLTLDHVTTPNSIFLRIAGYIRGLCDSYTGTTTYDQLEFGSLVYIRVDRYTVGHRRGPGSCLCQMHPP